MYSVLLIYIFTGLSRAAAAAVTFIASSTFCLPCGFAAGVCFTWCWMTRRKRQQQEQKQSSTVAEREQVSGTPFYEEVSLEDKEVIEVDRNVAYGPAINTH